MDIRDILKSFDQLTEGDSTVHKAGPGGYGNRHGSEDVTDQYGKPIGRTSLSKMSDAPAVKRGKGRPPKAADASGEVKSYDSSALSKAMGMGKAPKATGKPSVKHSLKEYFSQLDDALSEAGLAVQPMPATPQQKQQQAVATKPSFMIKDPANPNMPAITTQDPAVVQAAKNGTMSMQKPGTSSTSQPTPGATPAAGAGSQVKTMEEGELDEISDQLAQNALAGREDNRKAALQRAGSKAPGEASWAADLEAERTSLARDRMGRKLQQRDARRTAAGISEEDIGKHNNATTGFDALVRKLTPKYGKEAATKIAGSQFQKMKEGDAPQHFAQSSPLSTANRGVLEGKKGVNPFAKKDDKKDDKKKPDANKNGIPDYAEDGKGPNDTKKKGAAPKKGVNPFAKKTEKKKVKEGMEHHLQAARLEGKSHALRKMPYNCTHDDMEEARHYHEGFKEGLDECYGQMPILGRTAVDEVSPEVGTMASYGAHDEMDEGNAFTAGLAKTPHGGKFKVGGSTFTDRTRYDSNLDEFAFESLDKQLNSLLESEEKVSEGMTVSISKGQQGSPDSVSVSAQDGEADQLLSIIKSAGMGLFGGEDKGFSAPEGSAGAHGGISVVDDHDGMMSLMKKLSGGGDMPSGGDYESEEGSEEEHMHGEEGHSHEGEEEPCNECGMMECECGPQTDQTHDDQGDPVMGEEESRDQMAYEVAEDNPPDNGSANSTNDEQGNAAANQAVATADEGDEEEVAEESKKEDSSDDEEDEEEVDESIYESYANSADDTFEADIEFMTKVISGGLNKQKSTGQTTVPVVAGQKSRMGVDGLGSPMKESTDLLKDYLKLSGL